MSELLSPLGAALVTWQEGRAITRAQFHALLDDGYTADDVAAFEGYYMPRINRDPSCNSSTCGTRL